MHGFRRKIKDRVHMLLENFPAVALLGPRQCGKTALALDIGDEWKKQSTYLDMERVSDRAKLDDAVGYLEPREEGLVIMDEVHARPGLFPELRGLIDSGRRRGLREGRFLFLGSASYDLLRQSGESLAGRVAYLELTPFLHDEVPADGHDRLWVRGGFPDSFLARSGPLSHEWRRSFIETYLSKDLSLLQQVGPLPAMRDLFKMTAHLQGQVLNITTLAESHEFSRPVIKGYLDLFEQTFMIRRLTPYFVNVGKRISKRPKIYIRDSGVLHSLMGIHSDDDLRGHPIRGASWEGFMIEQIIALLPSWEPTYYRTAHGAELDLVMIRGDRRLAFEIKVSTAPVLTKGFHTARADVKPERIFVVSRNDDTWTDSRDITFTHLPDLAEVLAEYVDQDYREVL